MRTKAACGNRTHYLFRTTGALAMASGPLGLLGDERKPATNRGAARCLIGITGGIEDLSLMSVCADALALAAQVGARIRLSGIRRPTRL